MTELSQDEVEALLAIVKLITVFAGLYIVFLGLRAYTRLRQRHVLVLTVGLGVLTLGAISEGLALQGLGWTTNQSHIFEAFVTLLGFLVLLYSLVAK